LTETEWLACADPMPILEFLTGKAGKGADEGGLTRSP
jgi:hypothetical protein